MHLSRLLFAVRASLWLVPLLCVAAAVERHYDDQDDAIADLVPDPQGIGSGPDVSAHLVADPVARRSSAPLNPMLDDHAGPLRLRGYGVRSTEHLG